MDFKKQNNIEILSQVFAHLPMGVGIFQIPDLNDIQSIRYIFMNNVILYEMRKTKEEIFGKRIIDVAPEAYEHEGGLAVINTYFKIAAQGGSENLGLVDYSNHMVAGTYECSVHHIIDNYVYVMLRNVTELEKTKNELELANNKLKNLVILDDLTGVHNRRYLNERLTLEFARALRVKSNLSTVMLDIDFFKKINDSCGHPTGDKVLQCLSMHIKERIRKTDIISRFGGDEFCLLLPDTSLDAAVKLISDLKQSISKMVVACLPKTIKITCSFGVSHYTDNMKTPNDLLKEADKALYQAKAQGRNRIETI